MKNLIVPAIVGLAVMAGGFFYGMRLAPKPVTAPVAATAPADGSKVPASPDAAEAATAATHSPAPDAISMETLRKTSESMMELNKALQAREALVAQREQKANQREAELDAERLALDRTHGKFRQLFSDFQSRLQLVENAQLDQVRKQADIYNAMGTEQSIELIRSMDDPAMTRLFSVMETKPLAKLMAAWKAKYPADSLRLLGALNGMAEVLPKEQLAINDAPTPATDSAQAPATPAAAPAPDAPATPATPDATPAPSQDAPAPDALPSHLKPVSNNPINTATTN